MLVPVLIDSMLFSLVIIFLVDIIYKMDVAAELKELVAYSNEVDF